MAQDAHNLKLPLRQKIMPKGGGAEEIEVSLARKVPSTGTSQELSRFAMFCECHEYRSIQIDCRQTFLWGELISNCRYRIVLPGELIFITETDLREFSRKSLTTDTDSVLNSKKPDTDFGLETN